MAKATVATKPATSRSLQRVANLSVPELELHMKYVAMWLDGLSEALAATKHGAEAAVAERKLLKIYKAIPKDIRESADMRMPLA